MRVGCNGLKLAQGVPPTKRQLVALIERIEA